MFPFLSLFFFFMAVILPSGHSSKGKASAETPLHLEQHLPKTAQTLISPLSDDDREVLFYMLAFGLHLQMLAGVVPPASKLQWKPWKASNVKAGLKRDHAFPSHSLQSMSGKSRSGPQKASSLFAHKPSFSCDCFSCYSSFWSRWAASPNRDLLNMIIEITEMEDVEEEQKVSKGKEKKKKQEKKCIVEQEAGGKKVKGGKWKLQSTPKTSATSSASVNMVEAISATEIANDTSGCTSMDVMYDALWDSISKDEAPRLVPRIMDGSVILTEHHRELKDRLPVLPRRTEVDASSRVSTMKIKNSWDADIFLETSSWASSKQGKAPAMVEGEVHGSSASQMLSPGGLLFAPMQGKNNLKFQCAGKRKSSQIAPLVFDDTYVLAEDQESNVSSERTEGPLSSRVADANLRGKGLLSRIFPDALCGVASRLWDLVSMGSRNHSMDY